MKTIPKIRKELLMLANKLDIKCPAHARKIRRLVKQMKRRSPIRRSRRESASLTPELALRIRKVALANPSTSYMQLARIFATSIGRVSEALAGKRDAA
jgi:hypothetical protein